MDKGGAKAERGYPGPTRGTDTASLTDKHQLTLVAVHSLSSYSSKFQHDILLLQSLVVVPQVLDVVNCLAQHARLVQLTHTHTQWLITCQLTHHVTYSQLLLVDQGYTIPEVMAKRIHETS